MGGGRMTPPSHHWLYVSPDRPRSVGGDLPGIDRPVRHDASDYRLLPRAVAFPQHHRPHGRWCCGLAVRVVCRSRPRGGGTSMAGNAVGPSAVLVCSRYMNRALDIDAEARTAQDEAGVVLGMCCGVRPRRAGWTSVRGRPRTGAARWAASSAGPSGAGHPWRRPVPRS
ncbi:FAD-binding protein [Streptomyces sp. NPDC093984]|uniref:FAD-binding protein n=1 Tax=Streptomyces sp. NPDC093984 TaxID=3366052 RepID=UPI00381EDA97